MNDPAEYQFRTSQVPMAALLVDFATEHNCYSPNGTSEF